MDRQARIPCARRRANRISSANASQPDSAESCFRGNIPDRNPRRPHPSRKKPPSGAQSAPGARRAQPRFPRDSPDCRASGDRRGAETRRARKCQAGTPPPRTAGSERPEVPPHGMPSRNPDTPASRSPRGRRSTRAAEDSAIPRNRFPEAHRSPSSRVLRRCALTRVRHAGRDRGKRNRTRGTRF